MVNDKDYIWWFFGAIFAFLYYRGWVSSTFYVLFPNIMISLFIGIALHEFFLKRKIIEHYTTLSNWFVILVAIPICILLTYLFYLLRITYNPLI